MTPASCGQDYQHQVCCFGNSRIRTGTLTGLGGLAEVGTPHVVIVLRVRYSQARGRAIMIEFARQAFSDYAEAVRGEE